LHYAQFLYGPFGPQVVKVKKIRKWTEPTIKTQTLKFIKITNGASLSSILRRSKERKFGFVKEFI
jgi:hypothetical protein